MKGKERDGCSQALPFLLGHPLLFSPDVLLSPTIICLLHLRPGQIPTERNDRARKVAASQPLDGNTDIFRLELRLKESKR